MGGLSTGPHLNSQDKLIIIGTKAGTCATLLVYTGLWFMFHAYFKSFNFTISHADHVTYPTFVSRDEQLIIIILYFPVAQWHLCMNSNPHHLHDLGGNHGSTHGTEWLKIAGLW